LFKYRGGKIDITTGRSITTRVINRIIAGQNESLVVPASVPPGIVRDVPFYDTATWEQLPLHKELVASLEKCREYVNRHYLNVELTSSHVEDILRFFCSDINCRIFINNREEYEILHNVIVDMVTGIEEMTETRGIYDKIIDEMENQCRFPRVRSRG
jgi:hypothetical protein